MRAWTDVSRSDPCTICGKADWCARSRDGIWVLCRRVGQGGIHKTDKTGVDYWLYRVAETPARRAPTITVPERFVARCAAPAIRDRIYRALLAQLPLTAAHRQALRERGLPDAEMQRRGYRSLPQRGRAALARRLVEQFGAETCTTVPGLYVAADGAQRWWSLAGSPGLLIPVRDADGHVVALKVRADDSGDGPRYSTISSVRRGGPGPGTQVHVPSGAKRNDSTLRLTEGELKADVATVLSGILTVSVPGVSNWRQALPVLKALGATRVVLAWDADWRSKPDVARSLGQVALALAHANYEVTVEDWSPTLGKGIDDLLAAGHTPVTKSYPFALGAALRGQAKVWQGTLPTLAAQEVPSWH